MASEKVETQSRSPSGQAEAHSGVVDLENKVLQIGTQKYYIDMRQTGDARFFAIVEVIPRFRRSRVVVPMVVAEEICQKIEEMAQFAAHYSGKADTKASKDKSGFIHSISVTTSGRRRYYFDLMEVEDSLSLKISYVYGDRRDNVHIVVDALPDLLGVLRGFVEKYPSISPNEDLPPKSNTNRRNYQDRPRRNPEAAPRVPKEPSAQVVAGGGDTRRNALTVLADPAPVSVDFSTKTYTFEVVVGSNTFLRVTEIINGTRKSTLHVPIEGCSQILTIIGDFASKMQIGNGSTVPDATSA